MRTYFRGLQPGQRILIVAAVAISALALVAVGWWSWAAQYEVVYSSSNPGEVEDVAKALEEQGIPFRIAESGRAAASSGKILGFEVLDNIELGTSPQRERWAYQRALQGELQKTIGSLEEVEWSRVHLVLPERSAFLRDEQPPSASVTVKLRPGAALAGAEVRGITALVAGAVDGLKPGDVVLVNQDGALLAGGGASDAQADGTSVLGPSLLALRGAEEQRTRNAIRDALVKVLGSPDDITVGVTVEVESAVVDQLTRSKDPDSQVLISEVIHEQAGETTKPTGIPGTASNLHQLCKQTFWCPKVL
jgi:flagellar M-ring protein FliF